MGADETTHRNQLSYQEVLTALPAYAQGTLDPQQHAAVDTYLNCQVDLFRQLDRVEAGQLPAAAKAITVPMRQSHPAHKQSSSTVAFAQVMEGYLSTHQLPDNPLLMRKAPQRITDQRTGQRFIVPGVTLPDRAETGNIHKVNIQLSGRIHCCGDIGASCRRRHDLDRLVSTAPATTVSGGRKCLSRQGPTVTANQPRLIDTFGLTPPTTAWLTSESQPHTPLGTLFIDDQQGHLKRSSNSPPYSPTRSINSGSSIRVPTGIGLPRLW